MSRLVSHQIPPNGTILALFFTQYYIFAINKSP
nr:MAG TPA: hypothetical protein [Caudoviricetes sp.]